MQKIFERVAKKSQEDLKKIYTYIYIHIYHDDDADTKISAGVFLLRQNEVDYKTLWSFINTVYNFLVAKKSLGEVMGEGEERNHRSGRRDIYSIPVAAYMP